MDDGRSGGRIAEYDVLRIVALAAVTAIHVLTVSLRGEPVAPDDLHFVLGRLLRFAVPAFVFVSAALSWTKPVEGVRGYARFLTRRAWLVVVPYVVWSAVYHQGTGLLGGVPAGSLVSALLTGSAAYHLYFVPLVVQLYLVTPLMGPLVRRWPVATVVIGTVAAWQVHSAVPQLAASEMTPLLLVLNLPYAALGAWYGIQRDELRPAMRRAWPILLALGTLLAYLSVTGALRGARSTRLLIELVYTSAILLGVLGASARVCSSEGIRRVAERLESFAYGVYLAHPLMLGLGVMWLAERGLAWRWGIAWFPIAVTPLVLGVTLALVAGLAATPLTRWTVGVLAPSRKSGEPAAAPVAAEDGSWAAE